MSASQNKRVKSLEMEVMDKIVSLCKRRGFIFPGSEIYGGIGNFWDYGPLGVELKRRLRDFWWRDIVTAREEVFGMDTAIIMHPKVWEASGHVQHFHDPLVDCKKCKKRFRADHVEGETCPECGGELTEARDFNLMFETYVGPVKEEGAKVYLRPETAQGIYVNFLNVVNSCRAKLPFGIAQIGKSFRNEISPGNFIFRTREFEQMELEYFVHPEEAGEWFDYWRKERLAWYEKLGVKHDRLRLRSHGQDELAHYASACEDVEYLFPFGWQELEGIAHRGTYDLRRHSEFSGSKLTWFDPARKQHVEPVCIEASAGLDRTLLTVLVDAYDEDEMQGEKRVVLRLNPQLAPFTAAVFPLVNKEGLPEKAQSISREIASHFPTFYDASGSVGKRYRRQDEIGTPYCITTDFQTMKDSTVTVRFRDSGRQDRVSVSSLVPTLHCLIAEGKTA